ncbi:MAG: type II toxin-antitoxin system HicB family antitoxin [Acidobacteriota bacterium]|jgi:predicted RNase H-like HicB family nuclease|nr:type II toxin-antitoxin system HicB family antitoxin [Acidobacteriota bacterium]
MKFRNFTALIEREDDGYVSTCPELDIASQGDSIEEAKANLVEAIELFWETADKSEIESRIHNEVFITQLEVAVG